MPETKLYFLADEGHPTQVGLWWITSQRRRWKQYYPAEWGLNKVQYHKCKQICRPKNHVHIT